MTSPFSNGGSGTYLQVGEDQGLLLRQLRGAVAVVFGCRLFLVAGTAGYGVVLLRRLSGSVRPRRRRRAHARVGVVGPRNGVTVNTDCTLLPFPLKLRLFEKKSRMHLG